MCLSNFISFALVFTLTRRGIAICVLFFGTSHFNTHVIFPIFHSYLDETGYVYIPFHFIESKRISILISKLLLLLLFFVIQFINERDSLQFFFLSFSPNSCWYQFVVYIDGIYVRGSHKWICTIFSIIRANGPQKNSNKLCSYVHILNVLNWVWM